MNVQNMNGGQFWGYHGNRNSDDNKEGYGVMLFPTGAIFRGYWKNDRMHGHGVYEWGDGNVYEGEFQEGKQCGLGIYTWPTGGRYFGFWNDDKMSGKGVYVRHDGVIYEGFWMDDHQYGPGIKKIPERVCYSDDQIMSNERVIREYWDSNKKIMFQREIKIKPNINRHAYQDLEIRIRDDHDYDSDDDTEMILDQESYEMYKKEMNITKSTSSGPSPSGGHQNSEMKNKKNPPILEKMQSRFFNNQHQDNFVNF